MYFAMVESAASKPSNFNSDWILGAPQVGFSRDICRIRSQTAWVIFGLPTVPAWDLRRQYSLNLWRCHLTTVSGLTMISVDFQSGQTRDSHAQNRLSLFCSVGRLMVRCWTASCWRSARLSRIKSLRRRNRLRSTRKHTLKMFMLADPSRLRCRLSWFHESRQFYVSS